MPLTENGCQATVMLLLPLKLRSYQAVFVHSSGRKSGLREKEWPGRIPWR
jgi:hypothetical protein